MGVLGNGIIGHKRQERGPIVVFTFFISGVSKLWTILSAGHPKCTRLKEIYEMNVGINKKKLCRIRRAEIALFIILIRIILTF